MEYYSQQRPKRGSLLLFVVSFATVSELFHCPDRLCYNWHEGECSIEDNECLYRHVFLEDGVCEIS